MGDHTVIEQNASIISTKPDPFIKLKTNVLVGKVL